MDFYLANEKHNIHTKMESPYLPRKGDIIRVGTNNFKVVAVVHSYAIKTGVKTNPGGGGYSIMDIPDTGMLNHCYVHIEKSDFDICDSSEPYNFDGNSSEHYDFDKFCEKVAS